MFLFSPLLLDSHPAIAGGKGVPASAPDFLIDVCFESIQKIFEIVFLQLNSWKVKTKNGESS